jgi:acetoin utilization protein AcuB
LSPTALQSAKDLRALCARDVATPGVSVRPDTTLAEVADLMEKRQLHHFPVVEAGRLTGLLSERALRDAMPSVVSMKDPEARRRFLENTRVSEVATRNPPTCTPDAPLSGVITTMRTFRLGALPVVQGKEVVGLVTADDLVDLLERLLRASRSW